MVLGKKRSLTKKNEKKKRKRNGMERNGKENLCEIYIRHAHLNTHHLFFFGGERGVFHLLLS